MKRKRKISISGRFLTRKLTGVERYSIETVKALDKIVKPGEFEIVIQIDDEIINNIELENIKIIRFGKRKFLGIKAMFWEQLKFAFYTLKEHSVPFGMGNITTLLRPRAYIVVHDIRFSVMPETYVGRREKFRRLYHIINCKFSKLFAKTIFTDSYESKKQFEKYYKAKPERLIVTYCGYEHFLSEPIKSDVMSKYGLKPGDYFFAMASVARHKNFEWVIETAKNNPDKIFAIAGNIDKDQFSFDFDLNTADNLKFLGYISDDDARTLMKIAKAFLFPTLYEGFGLPPLEALSVGAQIIVSDIPVMREIYGGSARYIDPFDYNTDLDEVLKLPVAPAEECLKKYSWDKTAAIIYEKIKEIEGWE